MAAKQSKAAMINQRIEVTVSAPWAIKPGQTDRVEVRASETIRRLAAKAPERGGLSPIAVLAANYILTQCERAAASGASAIDYRKIKVDTSTRPYGGPPESILGAKTELAMVAAYIGQPDWSILVAICIEGRTVDEVARAWPTAKLLNGKADRATMEAIGRRLRDALEAVGERFVHAAMRPPIGAA